MRTPEYARRADIDPDVWECVRAVGLSFGWNRQETDLLSVAELKTLLADVVSKNGNLLLGVTPDDHGRIPKNQEDLLHGIGTWLDAHGEAIYGTRPWRTAEAITKDGQPVRFTAKGETVYGIIPNASTDPVALARTVADLANAEFETHRHRHLPRFRTSRRRRGRARRSGGAPIPPRGSCAGRTGWAPASRGPRGWCAVTPAPRAWPRR